MVQSQPYLGESQSCDNYVRPGGFHGAFDSRVYYKDAREHKMECSMKNLAVASSNLQESMIYSVYVY
jgi:hypothetical protein